MATFFERFRELSEQRSTLCVGIDPSLDILSQWNLPINLKGLRRFYETVIDASIGLAAVLKPQAAYFEQFGPEGCVELKRCIKRIRNAGFLALLDCKRGDIASTAAAYGQAYFSRAAYALDAITVSPYLGLEALSPLIRAASASGGLAFVVVRSSNPEGSLGQRAVVEDGTMVFEHISDQIRKMNASLSTPALGAVVGATCGIDIKRALRRMPSTLILAPGFGAQGASLADARSLFGDDLPFVLANVSRAAYEGGPTASVLRHNLKEMASILNRQRYGASRVTVDVP